MDTLHANRTTNLTVELSPGEIRALKQRTGKRTASAALKAWISRANPTQTVAALKSALRQSMKEEALGKGRRFKSGRDAVRWLEN